MAACFALIVAQMIGGLFDGKCPNILHTKVSHKLAYANSADPDQTAPKGESDQGLHCLPFH